MDGKLLLKIATKAVSDGCPERLVCDAEGVIAVRNYIVRELREWINTNQFYYYDLDLLRKKRCVKTEYLLDKIAEMEAE